MREMTLIFRGSVLKWIKSNSERSISHRIPFGPVQSAAAPEIRLHYPHVLRDDRTGEIALFRIYYSNVKTRCMNHKSHFPLEVSFSELLLFRTGRTRDR